MSSATSGGEASMIADEATAIGLSMPPLTDHSTAARVATQVSLDDGPSESFAQMLADGIL